MKSVRLKDYVEMINRIDLAPSYQRGLVWKKVNNDGFIDHLVEFRKVPTITLRSSKGERYECLDGQQRTTLIRQLYANEYRFKTGITILGEEVGGMTYHELTDKIKRVFDESEVILDIHEGMSKEKATRLFVNLQKGVRLNSAEIYLAPDSEAKKAAFTLAGHPVFEKAVFRKDRRDCEDLCLKLMFMEINSGEVDGSKRAISEFVSIHQADPIPSDIIEKVKSTFDIMYKVIGVEAHMSKTNIVNLYLAVQAASLRLNLQSHEGRGKFLDWYNTNFTRLADTLRSQRIVAVHTKFKSRRAYLEQEVEKTFAA